jgi:DNA repair protein RadC
MIDSPVAVVCQPASIYGQFRGALSDEELTLIVEAIELLDTLLKNRCTTVLDQPRIVRDYLRLKLALVECEVFGVIWLDTQNRVIKTEELFRGSVTTTPVYVREVARHALACNAKGAILYHNHPSGIAEPSRADENITSQLKAALAMFDVKVLDHVVIGAETVVSFAERGLLL